MKPPVDDHHDFDAPMTRAIDPTEGEPPGHSRGSAGDWTEGEDTRRQPPTAKSLPNQTEAAYGFTPMGTNPSTGGTPGRGVSGRIEPKQLLYNKFHVIKKLGGGAMGDVWLVHHATLKNLHALKLIVSNIASNEVALKRFQREFEVMASLNHAHAVRIYDACIDEDGGYIDMEYVEGQTLHDLVVAARRMPDADPTAPLMPLPWIVRILDQLTDVLQEAHDKGIVHRDLKPSNLMLLDGKKPGKEALKVLDFGIAKIRDDPDNARNILTEGFIGTPSYGSPEQAMSREDIDGRADLYSVGVMLYEFVTGRLPFKGIPVQVMHQHAMVPPPPFCEANPQLRPLPELERVILRVLAKDREQRPQTARDLFDEVHQAVEDITGPEALRISSSGTSEVVRIPRTGASVAEVKTEHDGATGFAVAQGGPDTLVNTATDPARSWSDSSTTGGSGSRTATDVALPTGFQPARSRRKFLLGALGIAVPTVVVGAVVALRPNGEPDSKEGTTAGTGTNPGIRKVEKNGPIEPVRNPIPPGYEAVVGRERPDGEPAQLRRKSDQVKFDYFAPGIYLPVGYDVVDKDDLVDGWPRLITRTNDPTQALFVRIQGDQEWTMGDWNAAPDSRQNNAPAHPVVLRSGFYIQKTEVTNGQFEDFLKKTGRFRPPAWEQAYVEKQAEGAEEAKNHPAVNVSHKMAADYCRYASALLPTEAQWEYAARSRGEQRNFVWKDDTFPDRQRANIDRQDKLTTSPVGIYQKDVTDQLLLDMTGNVKEMCRDVWKPYAANAAAVYDPFEDAPEISQPEYVIRGGDYNAIPDGCKTTQRDDKRAEGEFAENLGFRPVVECPDSRPVRKPR